ncbi:MAG: hypothetical protein PHU43_01850 [Candidatus Bipolaricaulis sp.]|nr:hypothetical protein [Candidatus Bipolaricaulis sp.]
MDVRTVRGSCRVALALIAVGFCALPGRADDAKLDCGGTEGSAGFYQVPVFVSCSEILSAEDAAEQFLDNLLRQAEEQTPEILAAALDVEATRVCGQRPEKGTVGELLGVDRWGCDAGYTRRNLCQGYVLEKIEAIDRGYAVVSQVVVSPGGSGATYFDAASAVRYKTPTGEVRIVAGLSLSLSPGSTASPEYEEPIKAARKGQARAVLSEALAYCENYKTEYCRTLGALATRITAPPSGVAPEDRRKPIALVVVATAPGHMTASQALDLASEDVSLVSVSGVVTDELGVPVPNAQIRFRDWDIVVATDVHGSYRLSAFGTGGTPVAKRVNLTLQRVELSVALEARPEGGRYMGVAADATSTLALSLVARGIRLETIVVQAPKHGSLRGTSGAAGSVSLDGEGRGTLTYVPPTDLETDVLSRSLDGEATPVWAAVVPLTFEYVDREGNAASTTVEVFVCRPPVVVTYAFAADQAAWTAFAEYARNAKFDPTLAPAFAAPTVTGSLEEQAELLRRAVAERLRAYALLGIKASKVDVVAHSLAGLIARHAIEEPLDVRTTVRRLLLIATPNHGASWLERPQAFLTSWLDQHPVAAQELGEDSDFLRRLNAGEATGTHLNPDVQYASLLGRRTELQAGGDIGLGAAEDDGLVSTASAHLNGAPDFIFDGVRHSEALALRDMVMASLADVQTKITSLLERPFPRADLDDTRLELWKGGGVVEISPQVWAGTWTSVTQYPLSLRPSFGLRTGKASYAAVGMYTSQGQWGTLGLDEDTEVTVRSSSPNVLRIHLVAGKARFRRLPGTSGGDFEVVLTTGPASGPWYAARPGIRVLGRDADFAVSTGDVVTVSALDSRLLVETSDTSGTPTARWVDESRSVRIRSSGTVEDEPVPGGGWWTKSVWREPAPPFRFPLWMLAVTLAGLAAATVYHVRASRRGEPPKRDGRAS